MKNKCLFLSGFMICSGCFAESDVQVSIKANPYAPTGNTFQFYIQAVADNVWIKGVTINRGNCKLDTFEMPYAKTPSGEYHKSTAKMVKNTKLTYGQIFEGSASCSVSSVREIVITTQQGKFVFTF